MGNNPLSSCKGKVGFDSYRLATQRADRVHDRTGDATTAYRCTHCHKFHIGHARPGMIADYKRRKNAEKNDE